MIRTTPWRRTTLQLTQIFLTDERTFIPSSQPSRGVRSFLDHLRDFRGMGQHRNVAGSKDGRLRLDLARHTLLLFGCDHSIATRNNVPRGLVAPRGGGRLCLEDG